MKKDNELIIKSKIEKGNLNKYQYTNSLIEEAYHLKLLGPNDIKSIQNQLMNCLTELIMQKTNGESTSLLADEAKNLMSSIIYTLDIYFDSLINPDEAVYQLKTEKISDLLKKGTNIISKMYQDVMDLYLYIVKRKLKVPLHCYHTSIDEAMPIFLKFYNILFAAHVVSTTIDYPLAVDDWDVVGVKYIHTYLKNFILETNFCKIFGDEKVEELLECFGKKIRMDYKLELVNIFELVYQNAIFMLLDGKKTRDLIFTSDDSKMLAKKLEKLNSMEMKNIITKAVYQMFDELNITDETTIAYIFETLPNFLDRLNINKKNQSIESMIISEFKKESIDKFCMFQSGEEMNRKTYEKVIKKVNEFYDAEEKANYIISNITSFYDFIDILNLGYLYGDEYDVLFGKLSDLELAILVRYNYYEEMRDKTKNLQEMINDIIIEDYEWQMIFSEFLKKSDDEKLNRIEKYMAEIDYEQLKFD